MPRRSPLLATDAYRRSVTEAQLIGTLREYAEALGGFTRHVRTARGQDLVGVPDVLLWVPAEDRSRVVLGLIELKIGDDPESVEQRMVRDFSSRVDGLVACLLRAGREPGPGETDLDGVLFALERARRWPENREMVGKAAC